MPPKTASRHRNASSCSQLPRVLLQVNPGIARQTEDEMNMLDKLRLKAETAADGQKRRFLTRVEDKWNRKMANSDRRRKMDEETRKALDLIKAHRRASMARREQTLLRVDEGEEGSVEPEEDPDDDNDSSLQPPRAWTPTTAMAAAAAAAAKEDEYGGGGGIGSVMSSRRSSLRSVSAFELEGVMGGSRVETPGPEPTVDPLEDLPASLKPASSVAASRKSSLTSSLMPEVVVTKAAMKDRDDSPSPSDKAKEDDKDRLQAPKNRIWNLLPAPTPTRFVGRMHAVVSSGRAAAGDAAEGEFSRKSSIVSETIQEDPDSVASNDAASVDGSQGTAAASRANSPSVVGSEKAEEATENKDRRTPDPRHQPHPPHHTGREKKTSGDSLPISSRFVGKMRGTISKMHSISSQDDGPVSRPHGGAAGRRGAWRSAAQQSKDGPGSRSGSALRRMQSIASEKGRRKDSRAGMHRQESSATAATPVRNGKDSAAGTPDKEAAGAEASKKKQASRKDVRKYGGVHVKLSHRNSEEILGQFGRHDRRASIRAAKDRGNFVLPGMKRPFSVERQNTLDQAMAENAAAQAQAMGAAGQQTMSPDFPAGMNPFSGDVYAVVSSASRLVKSRFGQLAQAQQQQQQQQQALAQLSRSGSVDPLGNLVKGVATTSKLMGKLASMRARENGAEDAGGAADDPDDKWDWMTGVPTSIRFVGKSWRNIVRGPGGIVTETPVGFNSPWKRFAKIKKENTDFAATVNMLTLLAKADMKLKSQAREAGDGDSDGDSPTDRMARRRSSTGPAGQQQQAGAGGAKQQTLSPQPAGAGGRRSSITDLGAKKRGSASTVSGAGGRRGSKESALKTDSEEQSESTEKERALRDLMEHLSLVENPSIHKWNVDKNIKEEAGGAPFLLMTPADVSG